MEARGNPQGTKGPLVKVTYIHCLKLDG